MNLKCSKCLELKPTTSFSVDKTKTRGYQYTCKDCHNDYTRNKWYVENRERQKENSRSWKLENRSRVLATKYKVDVSEIDGLMSLVTQSCPICNRDMKRPHLDHNHSTGKVRNFICSRCNTALGLVEENTEILKNLTLYIEKHASIA